MKKFLYEGCKFLFWISIIYVFASCIGILAIFLFRPDLKVLETVPFLISLFIGTAIAYILGGWIYGKKK